MPHEQFKSCIDACFTCAEACDHCAASCLKEKDVQTTARCIALDIDYAEICRQAAAYMSRGSECTRDICALCADVCDTCAEECRRMAGTQSRHREARAGERRSAH